MRRGSGRAVDPVQKNSRVSSVVEQWTENPRVPSSILGPGTSYFYGAS